MSMFVEAYNLNNSLCIVAKVRMDDIDPHVAVRNHRIAQPDHGCQAIEVPLDLIELGQVLIEQIAQTNLKNDRKYQRHICPHHCLADDAHKTIKSVGERRVVRILRFDHGFESIYRAR